MARSDEGKSSTFTVDSAGAVVDWPIDVNGIVYPGAIIINRSADICWRTGTSALSGTDVLTSSQSATAHDRLIPSDTIPPAIQKRKKLHSKIGFRAKGLIAPTGSIDCDSGGTAVLPADGDEVIIDDGTNPAVTFEFDTGATVVETDVLRQVDISAASDDDDVRDALITAITNAPTLLVSAVNGGAGFVTLTHDELGLAGNVAITEDVAAAGFVVTGMVGGTGEEATVTMNAEV